MNKKRFIILVSIIAGCFLFYKSLLFMGYLLGAARYKHAALQPGNVNVPQERTLKWGNEKKVKEQVLTHWAAQPLVDFDKGGKSEVARLVLARFCQHVEIDEANHYLLRQVPHRRSGSIWRFHKKGDYDFTLVPLTAILYMFGDLPEILYPETRQHLLDVLLIEEGGKVRTQVPRSLGLVRDTENHLLMTEGSRYLKNRWLALHSNKNPKFDNIHNGLENWLLSLLQELSEGGLYEFNSIPYYAYTISALLNLDAFAAEPVQMAARNLLDRINWEYAIRSLSFRCYPPFRRQPRRAGITSLNNDNHTTMMMIWYNQFEKSEQAVIREARYHSIWPAVMPYRLPDEVVEWVAKKPSPYFIRIGHGPNASPELYSGGPGYLISAGGVHRGWRSLIIARPITLLLDDNARDLNDVVYLAGPGDSYKDWNNTGVYQDFAVTAGPVHVPDSWKPEFANNFWKVYSRNDSLTVAIHSEYDLGVMALFHTRKAKSVFAKLETSDNNEKSIYHTFIWPAGNFIEYDLETPENKWTITVVNGQSVDRDFDSWPLMSGDIEKYW